MAQVEVQDIIDRLAREVSSLTVRLAMAEAQIAAHERADVDRLAEQENDDATS